MIHLKDGINEETAGRYAGMIASAFMLGRATTSILWGQLADTYGRTTTLYMSLSCSLVLTLLFGFSRTFAMALTVRLFLGMTNGIMSSVKTIVSEISHNDDDQARRMSIVIGMWGLGFLISPAISGALAEPVKQYPHAAILQPSTTAGNDVHNGIEVVSLLQTFPFVLPNLLGSTLCVIAITLIRCFVPETIPHGRSPWLIPGDAKRCIQSCLGFCTTAAAPDYRMVPSLKAHDSNLDDNESHTEIVTLQEGEGDCTTTNDVDQIQITMSALWGRRRVRVLLILYCCYSFVSNSVDELVPLFCMSRVAGFGIAEKDIGKVLSLCGLLFVLGQYPIFATSHHCLGLLRSVRLSACCSTPLVLLIPISRWWNRHEESGTISSGTVLYLGTVLAIHRIFSFVFFTNISVMLNQTVPSRQRATMNGFSNVGVSVANGLGPLFAGVLVSRSVIWFTTSAAWFMCGTIGCLGIMVALSTFFLQEMNDVHRTPPSDDCGTTETTAAEEVISAVELTTSRQDASAKYATRTV